MKHIIPLQFENTHCCTQIAMQAILPNVLYLGDKIKNGQMTIIGLKANIFDLQSSFSIYICLYNQNILSKTHAQNKKKC